MSSIMKAIGSIFSPQMPKMPKTPSTVTRMPDPESPALKLAARRKVEERRERGRAGTIYTGGSYSNQNLGGTQ